MIKELCALTLLGDMLSTCFLEADGIPLPTIVVTPRDVETHSEFPKTSYMPKFDKHGRNEAEKREKRYKLHRRV